MVWYGIRIIIYYSNQLLVLSLWTVTRHCFEFEQKKLLLWFWSYGIGRAVLLLPRRLPLHSMMFWRKFRNTAPLHSPSSRYPRHSWILGDLINLKLLLLFILVSSDENDHYILRCVFLCFREPSVQTQERFLAACQK